ncbi:hypothetical protein HMPREF9440_00834 [Sutterella parvirubra YIT 11816]|uniref:Uncharacterized protein n=1 Tax=Sutterella parvirubra YIT 11816 TaxID=762967 RepID=H3KDM5_9BURK|nr:hypothetical protein HMPREF9440_00834 [Sutterella parvirubra YIT 11816]
MTGPSDRLGLRGGVRAFGRAAHPGARPKLTVSNREVGYGSGFSKC